MTGTQTRILDELRGLLEHDEPRPTIDDINALRLRVDSACGGMDHGYMSKFVLSSGLGCLRRVVADRDGEPFSWSIPKARGTIVHKAVELGMFAKEDPAPHELVERSIDATIAAESGLGSWLSQLDDIDRSDLTGRCVEVVDGVRTVIPELSKFRPVVEARIKQRIEAGTLAFAVDLIIGKGERRVLVDWKHGRPQPQHMIELGWYALADSWRRSEPVGAVATVYLDSAAVAGTAVTYEFLERSTDALVESLTRLDTIAGVADWRDVDPSPSAACRWCPINQTCDSSETQI